MWCRGRFSKPQQGVGGISPNEILSIMKGKEKAEAVKMGILLLLSNAFFPCAIKTGSWNNSLKLISYTAEYTVHKKPQVTSAGDASWTSTVRNHYKYCRQSVHVIQAGGVLNLPQEGFGGCIKTGSKEGWMLLPNLERMSVRFREQGLIILIKRLQSSEKWEELKV